MASAIVIASNPECVCKRPNAAAVPGHEPEDLVRVASVRLPERGGRCGQADHARLELIPYVVGDSNGEEISRCQGFKRTTCGGVAQTEDARDERNVRPPIPVVHQEHQDVELV